MAEVVYRGSKTVAFVVAIAGIIFLAIGGSHGRAFDPRSYANQQMCESIRETTGVPALEDLDSELEVPLADSYTGVLPFGLTCEWSMADGTVQRFVPAGAEPSFFFYGGILALVLSVVLLARRQQYPVRPPYSPGSTP